MLDIMNQDKQISFLVALKKVKRYYTFEQKGEIKMPSITIYLNEKMLVYLHHWAKKHKKQYTLYPDLIKEIITEELRKEGIIKEAG